MRPMKKEIREQLFKADTPEAFQSFLELPASSVIGALFSLFLDKEELIRWRAISAFGITVNHMAEKKMESARVIMRRLMWSLNDESGGIGWGSPEAMGEIMARNRTLAKEYHRILLSYAIENQNYLELEMLQRGLLWGIGRLGRQYPELVKPSAVHLNPFLLSKDVCLRGLGVWAALPLKDEVNLSLLMGLTQDPASISVYDEFILKNLSIAGLAEHAVKSQGKL